MAIVSHLYQFFHAETCQAYIHTLRWKNRPLSVPAVRVSTSARGTRTMPSPKRHRCKAQGCQCTFNDLTGTLLDGSKRSLMYWEYRIFKRTFLSPRRRRCAPAPRSAATGRAP
jgi:hypothetical protein